MSGAFTTTTNWQGLYQLAGQQAALFTTAQAAHHGISPELLIHHVKAGRIERVRRGIYRVGHLPPMDEEQLAELWLWSDQQGVLSHDTALQLHELSDALPAHVHMTVPTAWNRRRLRVPEVLMLHYAEVPEADRDWHGPVPVTRPMRTVLDCITDGVQPDLVAQAIEDAIHRGHFNRATLDARLAAQDHP